MNYKVQKGDYFQTNRLDDEAMKSLVDMFRDSGAEIIDDWNDSNRDEFDFYGWGGNGAKFDGKWVVEGKEIDKVMDGYVQLLKFTPAGKIQ